MFQFQIENRRLNQDTVGYEVSQGFQIKVELSEIIKNSINRWKDILAS
jgi:hypothetical protein